MTEYIPSVNHFSFIFRRIASRRSNFWIGKNPPARLVEFVLPKVDKFRRKIRQKFENILVNLANLILLNRAGRRTTLFKAFNFTREFQATSYKVENIAIIAIVRACIVNGTYCLVMVMERIV